MSLRQGHELDARLAGANLFGWFGPAIGLLLRNLPITLGGGIAAVLGQYLVGRLPWPLYETRWIALLHAALDGLVYTLVFITAYWMLARKESGQTSLAVNTLPRALTVGAQIYLFLTIAFFVIGWALILFIGFVLTALAALGAGNGLFVLLVVYGAISVPILLFLLTPLWAILGVAGALSTVIAVRGDDHGPGAVLTSLRLSFDQKWRVLWPSYVVGLLVIGLYALAFYLLLRESFLYSPNFRYTIAALSIVTGAFSLAMTFVIERAYAPDLGLWSDGTDPAAAPQAPAGAGPSAAAAAHATATPATASAIAAMLDQDLRSNQTRRLVELTGQGLAADARFFSTHPDSTITLAKKLGQLGRADLGVKVLNPFLKDHRAHRLHLTGALLAANLLAKDPKRLPDTARFLERVKALYPNEPMVDQLIKSTARAMAAAGP